MEKQRMNWKCVQLSAKRKPIFGFQHEQEVQRDFVIACLVWRLVLLVPYVRTQWLVVDYGKGSFLQYDVERHSRHE